jgi:hypothetical protein
MARDAGLEELIRQELSARDGISEKPMFGGLAFLFDGRLLCGARNDGMLVRLGRGNDDWALALDGIELMVMGERRMNGWVRAGPAAFGDDSLRKRLLDAALAYVLALPPK